MDDYVYNSIRSIVELCCLHLHVNKVALYTLVIRRTRRESVCWLLYLLIVRVLVKRYKVPWFIIWDCWVKNGRLREKCNCKTRAQTPPEAHESDLSVPPQHNSNYKKNPKQSQAQSTCACVCEQSTCVCMCDVWCYHRWFGEDQKMNGEELSQA